MPKSFNAFELLRVILLAFFVCGTSYCFGQLGVGGGGGQVAKDSIDKFKITGFPYLNYDRSQGYMYGALGLAFYPMSKKDSISPSSVSGALAIGTEKKSYGFIGFQRFYLAEDHYRITAAAGYFSFNFQFYLNFPNGDGGFINYNSGYTFAYLNVMKRLSGDIFAGVHGLYNRANTTIFIGEGQFERPITYLNNVGLDLTFDNRDDVNYPIKGFLIETSWDWAASWLGNSKPFNKINIAANNYTKLSNKFIQATRLNMVFGLGDVPFEGQEIVGGKDIRGYSEGKYRGNQVLAFQTETRFIFAKRFSAVAFVGVASATNNLSELSFNNLKPGIGTGIRYLMVPSEKMNVGLDIAVGIEDWSLSFTIGEVF